MEQFARAQMRVTLNPGRARRFRAVRAQMRDFPDSGRGGRLLVAELTRDSSAITSQCDLEAEAAQTAHRKQCDVFSQRSLAR